ncbi:MAG TPA: vWA domain-containing protein [Polyangiaceae bacterium]|nr:vWA domain-containing protein [Polyangiaceae bacterium]
MRKRSSSIALFATLLLGAAIGCSDDEGSTVDLDPPATAGTRSSSGGAAASSGGGAAGRVATAGTTSSSSAGSGSNGAPTEACKGLPLELSGDAQPETGGAAGAGASDMATGGEPVDAQGAGTVCNGVSVEAEAVPVDLFVIMDRSQSMAEPVEGGTMTRWEALHDAVKGFTEDQGAAEIRAGIGFFSLSGAGDDGHDCEPDAYAEPSVPIGLVSEVGPDLVAAMDDVAPGGLTPTVPAVQGAISYARSWARENPGRATLVVLVTDGFPTQCEKDPGRISEATRMGYESSEHIRTFVIGVGDVAKFNLDNYARAGGTIGAYLTDAGDVTSSFVEALNNITNRALACEYQLPPPPNGMKLDTGKVQVVYTPSSGEAEEVPSISSLAACAKNPNGGWYYDDAEHPSKITVCPCTCARFQAGRVDVRLGCKPRLGLR